MRKIILRLTEHELRGVIAEAVNSILSQQRNNIIANAIINLVNDITGINVNESKNRFGLCEGVPTSDSIDDVKKPGEVVSRKSLLKHIVIDYYDGMKPEEIAKKYKIKKNKINDLIKAGLRKFNGDDTFNIKPSDKVDKTKLAKPNKDFRERVFDIAKERIPDEEREKLFPSGDKWRTSDEKLFRSDKTSPIGSGDEMNKVQQEPGYASSPEFQKAFNVLLQKYLNCDETFINILFDYYGGSNFSELSRRYGINNQVVANRIRNAIETLRNSSEFKRSLSDLLNGNYDEKMVKSNGMTGYAATNEKPMSFNVKEDYDKFINDAYKHIKQTNTNPKIKTPDGIGYTFEDFKKYLTDNGIIDLNSGSKLRRFNLENKLRNLYYSSPFYSKWKDYIEKGI